MKARQIRSYLTKDMGPLPKWIFGGFLLVMIVGIPIFNGLSGTCCPSEKNVRTRKAIEATLNGVSTNVLDGWGHPLRTYISQRFHFPFTRSKSKILVISAGPDGRFDTEDDISN